MNKEIIWGKWFFIFILFLLFINTPRADELHVGDYVVKSGQTLTIDGNLF